MLNLKTHLLLIMILACLLVTISAIAASESELLQQLRADYYSLIDAMEEYEIAAEDYDMNADEKEDYSIWINQLREQFSATCYAFSRQPNLETSPDIPCDKYASTHTLPVNIDIDQENTDTEKTAAITGQFNDSLGDFDEKLLREQDRVKAMKPQNGSGRAGRGNGSGESGKGDGDGESSGEGGDGTSADGDSAKRDQQSGQSRQQSGSRSGQSSDQQGEDQPDSGARGRPRPGSQTSAPEDIPDGSDDDVVARQLREAAEMETDPELKAKLWEEYRRYKEGS